MGKYQINFTAFVIFTIFSEYEGLCEKYQIDMISRCWVLPAARRPRVARQPDLGNPEPHTAAGGVWERSGATHALHAGSAGRRAQQ